MRIPYHLAEKLLEEKEAKPSREQILKKQRELDQLFEKAGLPADYEFQTIFELRTALLVLELNPSAQFKTKTKIFDHYVDAYLTQCFGPDNGLPGRRQDCLTAFWVIADDLDATKQNIITQEDIKQLFPNDENYPDNVGYFNELLQTRAKIQSPLLRT